MYDQEKCTVCGNCLFECPNNDYDRETAIEQIQALREGRPAPILTRCVTCMACNEICPQGADPFFLIAEMQERHRVFNVPEAFFQRHNSLEKMPSYTRKGKPGQPAISLCISGPELPGPIEGSIFNDLTQIGGGAYKCHSAYMHVGLPGLVEEKNKTFIKNLTSTGEKEIIFPHANCYSTISLAKVYGIDVPFRPVHIFEYLLDHMKGRQDQIRPLNKNIAYHRPCSSRLDPDMEPILNELFELMGVERVRREYDYQKTLCCGAPLMGRDQNRMRSLIEKNIEDAKQAHADTMVFYCIGCYQFLSAAAVRRDMDSYMIIDLCRLALGEELPKS